MPKNWKRWIVWTIPVVVVVLMVAGTQSLRAPVPAEQYQECFNAAQKNHAKEAQCKTEESLWQRTLSDPVAYYTVWLTIFTGALAAVGVMQGWLTLQQIRLARDEFTATHRPQLKLRRFVFNKSGEGGEIRFAIQSVGSGVAEMLGAKAKLGYFTQNLPRPDYDRVSEVLAPRKFEPGASDEGVLKFDGYRKDTWPLHIFGYIVYRDRSGSTYTLAFCRQYYAGLERFGIVDDPDYEYSD